MQDIFRKNNLKLDCIFEIDLDLVRFILLILIKRAL